MEYCGSNLYSELFKSAKLHLNIILIWFITIAEGIKCMHDNNYVHLDIKPENITIYNNKAKLIDFGLAENINAIEKLSEKTGTEGFKAPEMGKYPIDYKKCDIYSLGQTFLQTIYYIYFKELRFLNINKCLKLIGLEEMINNTPIYRPTIDSVITSLHAFYDKNKTVQKFTLDELHNAGFSSTEMYICYRDTALVFFKVKGYSINDIINDYKNSGYTFAKFPLIKFKLAKYTLYECIISGQYTIDEVSNIFSIREFKDGGATLPYLIEYYRSGKFNFSLKKLVDGGFKILELRQNGITLHELKDKGEFKVAYLKSEGGFTLRELVEGNFTLRELVEGGFSIAELNQYGITLKQFMDAGFSVVELKGEGGFTLLNFLLGGFTLQKLVEG
jgi:hypothetical protein